MTFGLYNAVKTFQRLINEVMRGLDFEFLYIDGICVASSSVTQYRKHIQIFQRLREFNLAINIKYCYLVRVYYVFLDIASTQKELNHHQTNSQLSNNMSNQWWQWIKKFHIYGKLLWEILAICTLEPTTDAHQRKWKDGPHISNVGSRSRISLRKMKNWNSQLFSRSSFHWANLVLYTDTSTTTVGAGLHQNVKGNL